MKASNFIVTYLPKLNQLAIELFKSYRQANINSFYLYKNSKYLNKLNIISCKEKKESYFYLLQLEEELVLGNLYEVYDFYNEISPVDLTEVVFLPSFEKKYRFDGALGASCTSKSTIFRLFSPLSSEVFVKIFVAEESNIYQLKRLDCGVFEKEICGDFSGKKYLFLAKINGEIIEGVDPYSFSLSSNGRYGVIINKGEVESIPLYEENALALTATESIIYELSVRDMTSKLHDKTSAFIDVVDEGRKDNEGNKLGFDYIKSLGITHVQLLPINDFQTVNEDRHDNYNWGYDPLFYFAPEGSYSSSPDEPYSRVRELRKVISSFHKNKIKVNIDVVFNHTYNKSSNSLDKFCPHYYYRHCEDLTLSNGSFCGNDLETRNYMTRKLIIDALKHYVSFYGVDGFRFDLMGIIDRETIIQAIAEVGKIKQNVAFYGEGWDMPTNLPCEEKCSLNNAFSLPDVSFFNDRFREIVKGKTSPEEMSSKGYILGNPSYIDGFKQVFLGSATSYPFSQLLLNPAQSINYVECHDNATLFDKIVACYPKLVLNEQLKILNLTNAVVLLAFGVPFIHAGQEIGLSKKMLHNTYNESDTINGFDYSLVSERNECVKFFQDCVRFRRENKFFSLIDTVEIEKIVSFENLEGGALLIKYELDKKFLYLFINNTDKIINFELPLYGKLIFNHTGSIEGEVYSKYTMINTYSLFIYELAKNEEII